MNDNYRTTSERGYGAKYQAARALLLRGNPACYWCGTPGADTADHIPSLASVGGPENWQGQIVAACTRCNYGRRGGVPKPRKPCPIHTEPCCGPHSRDW